jgi:dTDP-4-dehydrorhamnose reductase
MKILILGGSGMIGHQLFIYLSHHHDVHVTLRQSASFYSNTYPTLFANDNAYFNVNVLDLDNLQNILEEFGPEFVINATGVIKQSNIAQSAAPTIELNALFPHKLLKLCEKINAKLIQFSTDCIFSGTKGSAYLESDTSDALDMYGRTKSLGEVESNNSLTLRKSVIGLELAQEKYGLIEWFLAQQGRVKGFRKAIYTGVTVIELARILNFILTNHKDMCGIWNIASSSIDKFTLLSKLAEKLGRNDIEIIPNDDFICDRSLDASKFLTATEYKIPDWDSMLDELAVTIKARGC